MGVCKDVKKESYLRIGQSILNFSLELNNIMYHTKKLVENFLRWAEIMLFQPKNSSIVAKIPAINLLLSFSFCFSCNIKRDLKHNSTELS